MNPIKVLDGSQRLNKSNPTPLYLKNTTKTFLTKNHPNFGVPLGTETLKPPRDNLD